MRTTDMADELFRGPETELPAGVRLATAKRGGVTVTRVEIAREGLARPRGRYVTLEMPSVSVLDERDADVIETGAAELRALLPPQGPVLVLGIGSRRITADALGPRTAQKILVTMGPGHSLPVHGIRPVAAIAPGVSAATGLTLRQLTTLGPVSVHKCTKVLCSSCGKPIAPGTVEGLCSVCRIKERTRKRQEEARARAQQLREEREAKKAAEEAANAAENGGAAADAAVTEAAPAADAAPIAAPVETAAAPAAEFAAAAAAARAAEDSAAKPEND